MLHAISGFFYVYLLSYNFSLCASPFWAPRDAQHFQPLEEPMTITPPCTLSARHKPATLFFCFCAGKHTLLQLQAPSCPCQRFLPPLGVRLCKLTNRRAARWCWCQLPPVSPPLRCKLSLSDCQPVFSFFEQGKAATRRPVPAKRACSTCTKGGLVSVKAHL